MKKILLGVLAAFAISAMGIPAYAGDEAAPPADGEKKEKKGKKKGGKKKDADTEKKAE